MKNVLPHVNILKCDEEEAKIMTGKLNVEAAARILNNLGSEIILITQGEKGSTLCYNGKVKRIPAIPPDKIVDLTGAGDTYIAGFIVEYLRTGDPEWSAPLRLRSRIICNRGIRNIRNAHQRRSFKTLEEKFSENSMITNFGLQF